MIGGARFQESVVSWTKQSESLFTAVIGLALILVVLYAKKLSPVTKAQLESPLGRSLLLVFLYLAIEQGGWLVGVLAFMAVAVLLAPSRATLPDPKQTGVEGFSGGDVLATRQIPTKHRWFVERVLGENPQMLIEDRVLTGMENN